MSATSEQWLPHSSYWCKLQRDQHERFKTERPLDWLEFIKTHRKPPMDKLAHKPNYVLYNGRTYLIVREKGLEYIIVKDRKIPLSTIPQLH